MDNQSALSLESGSKDEEVQISDPARNSGWAKAMTHYYVILHQCVPHIKYNSNIKQTINEHVKSDPNC
jgi:hypothetical protein